MFLIISGFLVFIFFFYFYLNKLDPSLENLNKECVIQTEKKIVQGNSLNGLIESGEVVEILFDYYNCNEVEREDVVLLNYPGFEKPIIKIVKGVSGDRFQLKETEQGWHVLINGNILQNSEGIPYLLNEKRVGMLKLYEKDYRGIIPDNTLLLLGNLPSGSIDSTIFGLVDKSGILGKAIR
ncbi:hypothetical protein AMJ50_02745 [Parcubacteria bacterium DG_74_3]|nr:MAG: hypothetical protein AMJ50_02745 [Parcubacteria bacterium DG_74_3]